MKNTKIMVCLADDMQWTTAALHQACVLARFMQAEIVLVNMVRVQHLGWLGTELGLSNCHESNLTFCQEIAEDYGMVLSLLTFQYYALADAIVDAANHVQASVVFATFPQHTLSFWQKFQIRKIAHQLKAQQCQLYTLEKQVYVPHWEPAV